MHTGPWLSQKQFDELIALARSDEGFWARLKSREVELRSYFSTHPGADPGDSQMQPSMRPLVHDLMRRKLGADYYLYIAGPLVMTLRDLLARELDSA